MSCPLGASVNRTLLDDKPLHVVVVVDMGGQVAEVEIRLLFPW